MTGNVIRLQPEVADAVTAAGEAVAVLGRHLDRCKLAARTVRAYKRQAAAWLAANAGAHGDAFVDLVGAARAAVAWSCFMIKTLEEHQRSGGTPFCGSP